jgi:hypothetical protein
MTRIRERVDITPGNIGYAKLNICGDNFYVSTVEVRAINPCSNFDWNGTGIQPDVDVSAPDALTATLKFAAGKKAK